MNSFSYLEPVCCSMSNSNCCFLTYIQISQEAYHVVWYSHLFQNFLQFIVIHTIKGFGIVNKAEIHVFLELSLFSLIQWMLAIWSLVPLPFLKPTWTSGSSKFTYCWSLCWRILSITLLACEMSAVARKFEHSLALPFFGIGMKTDLFQSHGHCWVVQICWHIEYSTFTASSFRIWNSSTGIPSPTLALLVMMLPNKICPPSCNKTFSAPNSTFLYGLASLCDRHSRWQLHPLFWAVTQCLLLLHQGAFCN